jgi:hypothetical protein
MLQEMHCFQGKGPVICQKVPLQVQVNFHFFLFWCCKHTCATFWAVICSLCPCFLIGCYRSGFPLLRGQLSEEAANAGLALERHFVGLPGLADQYKVDTPPRNDRNEANKVCYTCDSMKLFFWRQKVRFWGKTFVIEVQKSFICPIKDRFGLQLEFINEPLVALR